MSRLFYHVMQDNLGNLLFGVSGTMRLAGTGTLATIYGDEALTVIVPNPMTNHPSYGSFKCFLGAGDYDFYMAKSGYTFETLTGVQGHGTMAQQDHTTVAITGGSLVGLSQVGILSTPAAGQVLSVNGRSYFFGEVGMGLPADPLYWLRVGSDGNALIINKSDEVGINAGPTPGVALSVNGATFLFGDVGIAVAPSTLYYLRVGSDALIINKSDEVGINSGPTPGVALTVGGQTFLFGATAVGMAPTANTALRVGHLRSSQVGLWLQGLDTDTGGNVTVQFANMAGTGCGSINCDATTTWYNTTSDTRLKEAVEDLDGALSVVQALRPVQFRWKESGQAGHGFLAQEVAHVVDGVISGAPDALDAEGRVRPQQIDYSKLVPWLTAAVKDLAAQVEALTARLAAVGG